MVWRCRRSAHRQRPDTKVGLAENMTICAPVIENAKHIAAAAEATRADERAVHDRDHGRQIHRRVPGARRRRRAEVHAGRSEDHLAARSTSSASTSTRRSTCAPTTRRSALRVVPHPPSFPHMASPWLFVGPEALYWGPRHVAKIWNVKEIYITENGCSSSDVPAADGSSTTPIA